MLPSPCTGLTSPLSLSHTPVKTNAPPALLIPQNAACGPLRGEQTLYPPSHQQPSWSCLSTSPVPYQNQIIAFIITFFFSIKLHLHSIILRQSHPARFQPPTGLLGLITDTSSYRVLEKKTCRN